MTRAQLQDEVIELQRENKKLTERVSVLSGEVDYWQEQMNRGDREHELEAENARLRSILRECQAFLSDGEANHLDLWRRVTDALQSGQVNSTAGGPTGAPAESIVSAKAESVEGSGYGCKPQGADGKGAAETGLVPGLPTSSSEPAFDRSKVFVWGTDGCRNCETGRITLYASSGWCPICLAAKPVCSLCKGEKFYERKEGARMVRALCLACVTTKDLKAGDQK